MTTAITVSHAYGDDGHYRAFMVELGSFQMVLALGDREVFLPFVDFPWFRDASVADVLHVERPQPHHLYWPKLDIDLSVEAILNPERFPLISRERPNKRFQRPAGRQGAIPKNAPGRLRRR